MKRLIPGVVVSIVPITKGNMRIDVPTTTMVIV
jgi:hypothetical protein